MTEIEMDAQKEKERKKQLLASWNVTRMMTEVEMEKERKKRLLELNIEVFGEDTPEANSAFIEVYNINIDATTINDITCYYQIVSISFGSERKTDPMDGVLFYSKDKPEVAEKWNALGTKRTVGQISIS